MQSISGESGFIEQLADVMPKTTAIVESGIEQGLHLGAQICVWHDGSDFVNAGVGTIDGSVPMSPEAVNLWMSSGKPVGAVAMKLLEHDGLLDLDAPVADYWPGFGTNGKESITSRHILTHTCGIRTAEVAASSTDLDEVLAILEKAEIERDWIPGKRAAYHAFSGWQVLGEMVRRISGRPYDEFVKSEIFEPLAMESSTFVLSPEHAAKLRDNFAPMYGRTSEGLKLYSEATPEFTSAFTRPGGGLHCTAHDLARFYRMVLGFGELDGHKLLEPSDVAEITSPQRTGMLDETFGQVMDWGLGIMLDNKIHGPAAPYGYGAHASARTFGHGGRQSSTGFVDPEHELVVALVFNGMPGEPSHDRRLRQVTAAIYEDLELA